MLRIFEIFSNTATPAPCSFLRYDVWLVDWRVSCDLPWAVNQDYTLDDCAAFDYPAAIDKVLEITQQVFYETISLHFKTVSFVEIISKLHDDDIIA